MAIGFEYAEKNYMRLDLPDEARSVIGSALVRFLSEGELFYACRSICARLFAGENTSPEANALAARCGLDPLTVKLALCVLFLPDAERVYWERGIGEDIFADSMTDITIWTRYCRENYGVWGTNEYGWLGNSLRGDVVRLGRLQFHRVPFKEEKYSRAGVELKQGDTVVNMHIPADGPLTREKRYDAYRRAYKFFGLTGRAAFVCNSWLLYPAHEEFLPPTSNILDFMRDFEIISSGGATDYTTSLHRMFGVRKSYDPAELPRDTGLRRAYAERLEAGLPLGWGYGVFIFDGEGIVR